MKRELKFMVVQTNLTHHPRTHKSPLLTGDGVLVANTLDGFYDSFELADDAATSLAEKWPQLDTYVVEVRSARRATK